MTLKWVYYFYLLFEWFSWLPGWIQESGGILRTHMTHTSSLWGKKSPRKYTVWRITSLGLEAWDETKPETFWRNWQFKCRWNQSEEENKFLTHRIFLTSKTRPCKMEGKAPVHCFESSQRGGEGMKTNEVLKPIEKPPFKWVSRI